MPKSVLNDTQWRKMINFFKTQNVTLNDTGALKKFIAGVFWLLKNGAPWRSLPSFFGHWNTVFKRFNRWSIKGIWRAMFEYFKQDPDMENCLLDSTSIKAHQRAAGYYKNSAEHEKLGRSSGGLTTKIHVLTDALGNPLAFQLTPGQQSDVSVAQNLIKNITGASIIADKGYDSDSLRNRIKNQNCVPVIPSRSNRNRPVIYDKTLYKERSLIENLFNKIKDFRRIATRYEKSARNFLAFIFLA